MTKRSYAISSQGCPDDTLTGGYFVAAYDAAKNYVGLYLTGYTLVSCTYSRI